jgi:hypothetical protein
MNELHAEKGSDWSKFGVSTFFLSLKAMRVLTYNFKTTFISFHKCYPINLRNHERPHFFTSLDSHSEAVW